MKQAFYFLSICIPAEEDLEEFGSGFMPIAEVKLQLREVFSSGQINLTTYELPLLYGEEEPEGLWC